MPLNADYQVRIVTDDERQDQIGDAIPLYIPWRMTEAARLDELFTVAACILQGHVQVSQNDLRCVVEQRRVSEPEFHAEFTEHAIGVRRIHLQDLAERTSWVFIGTTSVSVLDLGNGIVWDR